MNIKRCYLKVNIKLMAKIHSKKDLYDVVPKHKNGILRLMIKECLRSLSTTFLDGASYPSVKAEKKSSGLFGWLSH